MKYTRVTLFLKGVSKLYRKCLNERASNTAFFERLLLLFE
jgi:hypothetical protein